MEPDDRHYYCCGDCKALFPTLRCLVRHKAKCDGSKVVGGEPSLYAYDGFHLQSLLECATSCTHTNTCPLTTRMVVPPAVPPIGLKSGQRGRAIPQRARPTQTSQKRRSISAPSTAIKRQRNQQTSAPTESRLQNADGPVEGETHGSKEILSAKKEVVNEKKDSAESVSDSVAVAELESLPYSWTEKQKVSGEEEDNTESPPDILPALASVAAEPVLRDSVDTNNAQGTSKVQLLTSHCEDGDQNVANVAMSTEISSSNLEDVQESLETQLTQLEGTPCNDQVESPEHLGDASGRCDSESQQKSQVPSVKTEICKTAQQKPSTASLYEDWKDFRKEMPGKGNKGKIFVYVCDVCDWKTPHLGFFARHQKRHSGSQADSVWKCDQCDFTCKGKTKMKLHQNKHNKPFMCEFCSYRFARKKDLERHLYIHSEELPLKCQHCEYRCRQPKSLSEHMRKHTGELISCPVEGCEFQSAYKWAVKSHQLSKHVPTKRYQCPQCTYKTNDSNSMLRHQRLHAGEKNYKCSMCEYRAVAKHEIVRHMRSHTKEKLYFCDQCEFSTSHSSGLRIHVMNHLGVKPWQCVLCGFNSLTRSKVLRHVRQTHRGQGPADAGDAVVNLGLKLDIDIKEYKTPHEGSNAAPRVVYEVQQEEEEPQPLEEAQEGEDVNTVELIVHGLPLEEGEECIQVVTEEDPEGDSETTEMLDLTTLEGLQFRQLTNAIEQQQEQQQEQTMTFDNTESTVQILHAVSSLDGAPTQVRAQLDPQTQTWHVVEICTQHPGVSATVNPDEEEGIDVHQTMEVAAGSTTCEVAGQEATYQVAGQETTYEVAGQETTYEVAGQETTYQVAGQETTYQVASQETTYQVASQEATYQVAGQETTYQVAGQETTYQVAGQGSTYQVAGQDATYQVDGQETTYQVASQETTYQVASEDATYQVAGQESTYQVAGQDMIVKVEESGDLQWTDEDKGVVVDGSQVQCIEIVASSSDDIVNS